MAFFLKSFGGVLWLVLSLLSVLVVVLALLPGLCPLVGFGRVGLYPVVLVGRPLQLVYSCRSLAWHRLVLSVVSCRVMAFGFGFVLVLRVRPCFRLAVSLFPCSRSRWLFLLAGVPLACLSGSPVFSACSLPVPVFTVKMAVPAGWRSSRLSAFIASVLSAGVIVSAPVRVRPGLSSLAVLGV